MDQSKRRGRKPKTIVQPQEVFACNVMSSKPRETTVLSIPVVLTDEQRQLIKQYS